VIEIGGYTDQDSVQRQEILIEMFRKAGMNVKFVNAPIAEASASFFGPEKRGSGLLAAWTGRPDPSLTYSLMFTRMPTTTAAARRCRRNSKPPFGNRGRRKTSRSAARRLRRCNGW